MGFETIFLRQKITYWRKTGVDGFNEESYAAPVTLDARWEDKSSVVLNTDGQEVISNSRVFLAQDIIVDDYLMLGISTATDPRAVNEAFRVINYRKTPDLTATNFERKAFL